MSKADDLTTTNTYYLTCTDCTFSTTVEGNVYDALDVAEEHQNEESGLSAAHFVNFELDDDSD